MSGQALRSRALAGLPVAERRVEAAGIPTAVLEGGDGPPLVLLHGPGESALHWTRVIPSLVNTHRVLAPDLPGHGGTGPLPEGRATLTIDWLGELIAAMCEGAPTVVGTTLGGAVAARFAAQPDARLDALVLVDALGLVPFAPDPRFGQALNAFLAQPGAGTNDDLWRVCTYDLQRLRDAMGETWDAVLAYHLDRIAAPGTMAAVGVLMQEFALLPIPSEELERIDVPTTLIWGRHDLATSLSAAESASERYGWGLCTIERCGDAPALERPDAFVEAVETARDRAEVAR